MWRGQSQKASSGWAGGHRHPPATPHHVEPRAQSGPRPRDVPIRLLGAQHLPREARPPGKPAEKAGLQLQVYSRS